MARKKGFPQEFYQVLLANRDKTEKMDSQQVMLIDCINDYLAKVAHSMTAQELQQCFSICLDGVLVLEGRTEEEIEAAIGYVDRKEAQIR